jgi:hypothetical protein
MMDLFSEVLFAVSFLLGLVVTGCLWWVALRLAPARRFWMPIATGWALNLLGNVAWIAYDMVAETSLPPLSWVDGFYLARYLFVGLALWRYPLPCPRRRGLELLGVWLIAALVAWVSLFQPTLASTGRSWAYFVGVAMYPVLDAGLVYAAWQRWQRASSVPWKQTMVLLSMAMLSYGLANWINFGARMASPDADAPLATLFWSTTDVIVGLAAVLCWRREQRDTLI